VGTAQERDAPEVGRRHTRVETIGIDPVPGRRIQLGVLHQGKIEGVPYQEIEDGLRRGIGDALLQGKNEDLHQGKGGDLHLKKEDAHLRKKGQIQNLVGREEDPHLGKGNDQKIDEDLAQGISQDDQEALKRSSLGGHHPEIATDQGIGQGLTPEKS
jgi:hypothetical protein